MLRGESEGAVEEDGSNHSIAKQLRPYPTPQSHFFDYYHYRPLNVGEENSYLDVDNDSGNDSSGSHPRESSSSQIVNTRSIRRRFDPLERVVPRMWEQQDHMMIISVVQNGELVAARLRPSSCLFTD